MILNVMDVQRVALQRGFAVNDLSGTQGDAAQLHRALGHGVQMFGQRGTEAIQHFVHGDKVRTAHIPVCLLGDK